MKENLENSNVENPSQSTSSIWSSLVVADAKNVPEIPLTQIKFKALYTNKNRLRSIYERGWKINTTLPKTAMCTKVVFGSATMVKETRQRKVQWMYLI
ncbi:hypothetical protein P8452_23997 [Trifolium repens]|nr:hypothetical protein P8452_23997 [Trifolium repens]